MSAYHNQTNISPGTLFSGGGAGGSNFPSGLVVSNGGTDPNTLCITPGSIWGQPSFSIKDISGAGGSYAPIVASRLISKAYTPGVATSAKTGDFGAESIVFQGNNGAGNNVVFLNVIDSALNSSQTNLAFQMAGVSSFQSGAFIVNAEKMCSTLQGYGWA